MNVLLLSRGTTAKQRVRHAQPVWIDVSRCTSKLVQANRLPNLALLAPFVARTTTLPVKVRLDRSNVTSAAVIATTAMLVQPFASAVSCCWHAPWYLW